MLTELLHSFSIIHIAGEEYRIRFSLNALLCLEMTFKPLDEILAVDCYKWDIETVVQMVRAGLCDLPENRKAVCLREWDMIQPDLQEIGGIIRMQDLPLLRLELMAAILAALPEDEGGGDPDAPATDEGHLHALAVRVVGMSEEEFWDSSYRDIHREIDRYFEVKGMKEMPSPVRMFDKAD